MCRNMAVELLMLVESKSVLNKIIAYFKFGGVDLKSSPRLWLQTLQNLTCCVRESLMRSTENNWGKRCISVLELFN